LRFVLLYEVAGESIDAREEVLRIVSHDLRNPIGTIGMATELLLEDHSDQPDIARYLGIIRRQGEGMKQLVNDLLDASRIEAGRLPVHPKPTEVPSLIDATLELMRPLAEDHQLALEASIPEGLPLVLADSLRVTQVFSNLIGNAIKFTPATGSVHLAASVENDTVRFSVRDTGPGIPPDQISQIFRPLWQGQQGDTRGIGLGLNIARAIVEAHGETIGVRSELGIGTEFWFTLPVVPAQADDSIGGRAGSFSPSTPKQAQAASDELTHT